LPLAVGSWTVILTLERTIGASSAKASVALNAVASAAAASDFMASSLMENLIHRHDGSQFKSSA
jgi:hypothetical protein